MSDYGPEWSKLNAAQKAAVLEAIAECERTGRDKRIPVAEHDEAYAYPHPDGVSWGYDGGEFGFNIARGVRRKS